MITEIKKDLLSSDLDAIAHCANCFCTMGSGIARQIKLKLPEAYDVDLKTRAGDKFKFGNFSMAEITKPKMETQIKYVYNLYGQFFYGRESRKLNYESIYTALDLMRLDCITKPIKTIGFPRNMGCNLAGGHFPIVLEMIKHIFEESPFEVTICEYGDIK